MEANRLKSLDKMTDEEAIKVARMSLCNYPEDAIFKVFKKDEEKYDLGFENTIIVGYRKKRNFHYCVIDMLFDVTACWYRTYDSKSLYTNQRNFNETTLYLIKQGFVESAVLPYSQPSNDTGAKEKNIIEFIMSYKNDDSTIWALKVYNYAKTCDSNPILTSSGSKKHLKVLREFMQKEIDSWDDLSGIAFDLLLRDYAKTYAQSSTPNREAIPTEIEIKGELMSVFGFNEDETINLDGVKKVQGFMDWSKARLVFRR